MVLTVQVINKNKTSMVWPCHGEKGRVNTEGCEDVKTKIDRPRGRPRLRWLDNIDSHLKENNTSYVLFPFRWLSMLSSHLSHFGSMTSF